MTGSGWLLWPAGAAALTGIVAAAAHPGWPVEIVVFVAAAIAATYLGRRWLPRGRREGPDINDPSARLLGQRGEATAAFTEGRGRVFVDGKEWAADLDGGGDVAARAAVVVTEVIGGARLKVRAG